MRTEQEQDFSRHSQLAFMERPGEIQSHAGISQTPMRFLLYYGGEKAACDNRGQANDQAWDIHSKSSKRTGNQEYSTESRNNIPISFARGDGKRAPAVLSATCVFAVLAH